jgi:diacylglycerol kinase (ATP)
MGERFSLRARARSFAHAGAGFYYVLRSQHNARIHAFVTLAVVAAGLGLEVSRLEWCWLVVAIAMVWAAEAMNTALETLADATQPHRDPLVGRAKDAAAGAVLVAAAGAALIGLLVLGPHLWALLRPV